MKPITFLLFVFLLSTISCKTNKILPDPLKAGWKGNTVCELVKENKAIRVLKCTFPPGVGHERHFHKAHFGYTLAGSKFRMKDTTGVKEVQVLTGSDFYSNGTEWHEVLNIGDSTAVFLIVEPKL
ncbi:MAG: cupin domain-containing protein [Flavobacteriaceae bacterium]|nr:cupin domain-containing protein [Flavobacteriaceae bacterium]